MRRAGRGWAVFNEGSGEKICDANMKRMMNFWAFVNNPRPVLPMENLHPREQVFPTFL